MAAIIFDFDGTIADSLNYFIDFIRRQAGREPLSQAETDDLKGLGIVKIARRLGHPTWKLPYLFFKGRNELYGHLGTVKPFQGMVGLLQKLHAEGHELFIVSSNSVRNVRRFLRLQGLRPSFLEIYGGAILKSGVLKDLLNEHHLADQDTTYIGDEPRDIEAARSLGLRSVAVTWGYADKADLKKAQPSQIVDTPEELMSLLEEL